jgi:hypothetical protein
MASTSARTAMRPAIGTNRVAPQWTGFQPPPGRYCPLSHNFPEKQQRNQGRPDFVEGTGVALQRVVFGSTSPIPPP